MKCKKTLALVLAGTMLLPSGAFAADLSRFNDFPNDWSSGALEKAVDHGLLNGSNGKIDGQGLLTRAQMAAIVSRAFGATKSASLSSYKDVLPSAWYYSDMGKAVQMQTFQGSDGLLHPDDSITREEAFVVLARAFALTDGRSASLSDFSDNGAVSSWASGSLSALVENGYVNGANGRLNPKNNITRAEFAKIITDMAASYADSSSIANQTVDGNLIVRADGASLSGVTVNGDLIIADGGDKVSLDGVKVTGRIVIRGASTEASLKNCSAGKGVLVSNPNGAASISVSGGSVGTVTAKSDLVVSGSVDNIVIAEKAALTVQSGASVGSVTVSAAGASVSGAGTVSAVQANANNVTVSTKNTKVTAASGVSGVKAGDKTVDAGKTGTVGTAPSGGGSSGGGSSGGGGSSTKVTTWADMYKGLGVDTTTGYDAVTSATNFTGYHAKDIPTIINKNGASLDGVKLTGKTASVTPKLSSATYAYSSKYGTGEFDIIPDDTVPGYVWNEYKNNLYAVTISDGKTTVGALPWVDYYGENATSGYHYNKVQIALNNGISKASNEANVQRYKAFYDETGKHLKAGTYTVTLYSEGYEPLKAVVEVKADADRTATVTEADFSAGETTVTLSNNLPGDFTAAYSFTVNGKVSDFFTYENGKITWNQNAPEIPSGTYQLVIHDDSGKYADITAQIKLNVYAYASVPYDEYWKSEGVYLSGSDWAASSNVADRTTQNRDGSVTEEHDKGAFDAVSRATSNHGLHRGSFQQDVVIHTADRDYHPVHWTDSNNFVDQDGKTYNKTTIGITNYNITGIKYVPVKVSASDFADFCSKYTVTKNGAKLAGGFGELNLSAYTNLVAAVDADTNGLKAVTKGRRGGYTFGARQTGTGSGIQGQSQKTADAGIKAAPQGYSGSFGEMLRVDLDNTKDNTKYYGDLGSHMQTVVWKYYGDGDDVLATYGTKFAADNWMHKTMGIQLGLTDSLRFKLPEGTNGTGKWTLTVYALGYEDTTYTVDVTAGNLPQKVEPMTNEQKTRLESLRDQAKKLLDDAKDSTKLTEAETTLKTHYDEIVTLLANKDATKAAADELIQEVPGYITAVENERATKPTTTVQYGQYTISEDDLDEPYTVKLKVTLNSDGTIKLVEDYDTEPGESNTSFWNKAKNGYTKKDKTYIGLFTSLIGKSADNVDSVDTVSGATVSSKAIQKAVKAALGAKD